MVKFTFGAIFDHWVNHVLLLMVHMCEQLCDSNMLTIIVFIADIRLHNILMCS
jgi:hypothetical protein